jgi:broad specificity phosphatase PhoE
LSRIVLVRHGEAAASWSEDPDPGLSDRGREQAEAMAAALAPLGPLPIVVSPMRRARETAAPLEARWGVSARVEPAVGEIPSPTDDLAERAAWLGAVMRLPWEDWPPPLEEWRESVAEAVRAIGEDAVVVTHFVAITVIAHRRGLRPDYCSRTTVETEGRRIRVVELGRQREDTVLL